MFQTSAALLVMGLVYYYGINQALILSVLISVTALVGILAEINGLDIQSLLPSKYHDADSFTPGVVLYAGQDIRYRGFYAEASALGAVCGGLIVSCSLPFFIKSRMVPFAIFLGSFLTVFSSLCALGLSLTKAGILMLFSSLFIACCGIFFFNREGIRTRFWGFLLICIFIFSILYSFLPQASKDYFLSEWETIQAFFSGGSERDALGKGFFGRSDGFIIALVSLLQYPLGTAPSNVVSVVNNSNIVIGKELTYFFGNEVYGLKSFLSNLVVRSGIVGIVSHFLFLVFLYKAYLNTSLNIFNNSFLLNTVALASSIVFSLIVEERYFVFAYSVLLLGLSSYFSRFLNNA
jgi:hypothetical protein